MSTPWYRCFPADFNDGMDGLTLEERGAYITLLNMIYIKGGPIADDTWRITSKLDCTIRTWTKVRASLIVKGKLEAVELCGKPHLMNERASVEIAERDSFSRKKSEAGAKGGRNSRSKSNENNETDEAQLKHRLSDTKANHIHSSAVVPSNDETTGGEAPSDDPNKRAWGEAVSLLVGQGMMSPDKARSFFGKLLSANQIEARDLLGAIAEAFNAGTADPQGFLTKAALARGRRRQTGPPKRVGFV